MPSRSLRGAAPLCLLLLLATSLRALREYERAVVLRLGRLVTSRGPGVVYVIPFVEQMYKIDLRTITLRFDVELLNPGDGEMNVAGYEHELQIEGRSFTAGTSRDGFALAPHGTARVSVPVQPIAQRGRGQVAHRTG